MKTKRDIVTMVLFGAFLAGFGCNKTPSGSDTDNQPDPDPEPQEETFVEHLIDSNFDGIHSIKVIDLDGDGDLDIVGGSEITRYTQSRGVAWWRNNGGDPLSWTRYSVDAGFEHVMSVDVYDIDGDSYLDIVATSWSLHQIAWWENSGNPESNWTRRLIKSDFTNAHDARCFDINNDGFTDVTGVSSGGEVIVCYSDGSSPPTWDITTLNSSFAGGKTMLIHDIDQDGDVDLLGAAADADRITWWKNQGGDPITWGSHAVDHDFVGATGLDVIDLNSDGLYDIIGTSWKGDELSYWICQDLENDQWQKTMVTDGLEVAVNSRGCDMDMDGDIDIVAIGKSPGELTIYNNDNFAWTMDFIELNFDGGSALSVIDMDGDGDPDIVAGASGLGRLVWWENQVN